MKKLLTTILIIANLTSCASKPKADKELYGDIEWKFYELVPKEEPVVYVKKEDFIKIKRRLNQCESLMGDK